MLNRRVFQRLLFPTILALTLSFAPMPALLAQYPGYRPPTYRPPTYRPPSYQPPSYRPPSYRSTPSYQPPTYRPPNYTSQPRQPSMPTIPRMKIVKKCTLCGKVVPDSTPIGSPCPYCNPGGSRNRASYQPGIPRNPLRSSAERRNREIERKLANINWPLVVGIVVGGVLVVISVVTVVVVVAVRRGNSVQPAVQSRHTAGHQPWNGPGNSVPRGNLRY